MMLAVVIPLIDFLAIGQNANGMRTLAGLFHAQFAPLLDAIHRRWVGNTHFRVGRCGGRLRRSTGAQQQGSRGKACGFFHGDAPGKRKDRGRPGQTGYKEARCGVAQ